MWIHRGGGKCLRGLITLIIRGAFRHPNWSLPGLGWARAPGDGTPMGRGCCRDSWSHSMSQHNPGPLLSFPKNLSQESCQPQACPADALEWDISSQERRVAGSPQEAGARDTSAWSRVLASPFLRAAHSPPLSPRRFGHGQGTQAKPGQAGPEAAAWQQPVPVSAGTRGGGCDGGTWLQLGTVPHLAPLPPPALHHSPSNYSSPRWWAWVCGMYLPHGALKSITLPQQWWLESLLGPASCVLLMGCGDPPSPSEGAGRRACGPCGLHTCYRSRCWLQFWPLNAVPWGTDIPAEAHRAGDGPDDGSR